MTHEELCRMEQSQLIKLIDEGKLVYLPCKVEDTVYALIQTFIKNKLGWSIDTRIIDELNSNKFNSNTMITKKPFELHFYPSEIGKTVFLTREEAEKALKEREVNG